MPDAPLSGELFYPSEEVRRNAHVQDWDKLIAEADQDPERFWEKEANELHWFEHWEKVLDASGKPFYKWFTQGKTNIVYNCLDRHTQTARRNKLALMWEGEKGEFRSFSYFALRRETCRFANVLRSLGVQKGDRVT
ncbi:MAG: acetyl-coenzyme synthetase, partial [Bacteroidetes bacterium]|nr:acetyl-coenzyme synthetase [Bacteroidota bacterium]